MKIHWDRERTEPAEFIFPSKTTREADVADNFLMREIFSSGNLGSHTMELLHGRITRAQAVLVGRHWSLSINDEHWPHNHVEYRFKLTKSEAMEALLDLARSATV